MNNCMSAKARKELLENIREKYQTSNWVTKNKLLDEFVIATGHERKYACRLLNAKAKPKKKLSKKERETSVL